MRVRVASHAAALILVLLSVQPGAAQRRAWPSSGGTVLRIEDEALVPGLGVAGTVLVQRSDQRVHDWAVKRPPTYLPVRKIDAVFKPMGERWPLAGAAAVALVGIVGQNNGVRDAGLITLESLGATIVVKGAVARLFGRLRPQASPEDPGQWELLGGLKGRDHRSFPSGHAAHAFALAASVVQQLHDHDSGLTPYAAGVLFTASSATSFSRVLSNEHWLSDVVAGVALGAVIGAGMAEWKPLIPDR
jgi:membrane-associated phospholipid phosphatase